MADEELDPMEDLEDEPGEGEAEEGGGLPLMRYIYIAVGVLIVQVIIVYAVFSWWFTPSEDPSDVPPEAIQQMEAPPPEAPSEAPSLLVELVYEKLEPIVVNPAGTDGLRFLSTRVHLGISSAGVEGLIDTKNLKSKIRDTLINIFSSKTIPQLDPMHHEAIKDEIKQKLNTFLGENAILEVYFQGFVLQ